MSATEGDIGIITNIIGLFKEQADETYIEMKNLLEAKDYHNLGLLAHKVKSSTAVLGMDELSAMLKTFELQAKVPESIQEYPGYITMFKDYCEKAVIELDDFINELNSKK